MRGGAARSICNTITLLRHMKNLLVVHIAVILSYYGSPCERTPTQESQLINYQ